MAKDISIITIVCLCLMFVMENITYGITPTLAQKDLQEMQRHIDKMKIMSPQKYQEMVKRASGNIKGCTNCHYDVK